MNRFNAVLDFLAFHQACCGIDILEHDEPKIEGHGILLHSTCPVCHVAQDVWMRPTEAADVLYMTAYPERFDVAFRRSRRRVIRTDTSS